MFFYLQERRFLIEEIDEKAYPVPNSKPIISKSGIKVEGQKEDQIFERADNQNLEKLYICRLELNEE